MSSVEYFLSLMRHQQLSLEHDLQAAVKANCHTFSTTRGNKYKLQISTCHYNVKKYSFCSSSCQMMLILILLRID